MKRTIIALFLINITLLSNAQCWTWMKGNNSGSGFANYGIQGVDSITNTPGVRLWSMGWTDNSGDFWLFGGLGKSSTGLAYMSDLWKYDHLTGNWTWVKGPDHAYEPGVYGTIGVSHDLNTPGARSCSTTWTDDNGSLWLMGGYCDDTGLESKFFNDLWKFDIPSKTWTWMSGSDTTNQLGNYGIQGVPLPTNCPGGRDECIGWKDLNGNFWLMGGRGFGTSTSGNLNDLWKYDPASGNWTWMSGSDLPNVPGNFGTLGVASPSNYPGARNDAVSWTDNLGNLWLMGGNSSLLVPGQHLNDLWKYNILSGQWTWMKGSQMINPFTVYGTQGVSSSTNTPGGRRSAVSWTDNSGNLWMMGGRGHSGLCNDLWKYDINSGNWTWVNGSMFTNQYGNHGIQGVPAGSNVPGAIEECISFKDQNGDFWLMGGSGFVNSPNGWSEELWRYSLTPGVGLQEIPNNELFSFYPNPISEFLSINSTGKLKDSKYFIRDVSGRIVKEGELNDRTITIYTGSLPSGFYILQIENIQNTVFKFIKE